MKHDPIGNLKSKPGVGVYTYTASATGCVAGTPSLKPHAVRYAGSYSFSYDCNGNMTTRNDSAGSFTQQWDKENRLITVTGTATGSFVYDGDGNRVKATLNGVTTAYIGNYYEQTGAAIKKYYYAGGTRIALRQGTTVTYLLGDHLGSTSIAAHGTTGALVSEQRYKPWGEQRYPSGASTLPTRHRFTGQLEDVEIGLYFYGARSYSAVLGRFLSADTIVPDGMNPQQFNRYAYTLNSPLNYVDPSGHMMQCPEPCAGNRSLPPPNALPGWYEAGGAYEEYLRAKYVNHESAEYVANAYSDFEMLRGQARSVLPPKLWTPDQREETYREWGTGIIAGSAFILGLASIRFGGNGISMPESVPAGERLEYTAKSPADSARMSAGSKLDPLGTWGRPETLQDHFKDHGGDFGAKTPAQYAKMASDFLTRAAKDLLPLKVTADGVIRAYDPATNTFGAYNPDGTTRTFFMPSSSTYWDRQPGTPPWLP